jgi:hypothetical protein
MILHTILYLLRFTTAILTVADVDFSFLRTLKTSHAIGHEALRTLTLVESFSCLTTLLITCGEEQKPEYYKLMKYFLQRLPQLTALHVIAWPRSLPVAPALLANLRELWLQTEIGHAGGSGEAFIVELAARCPSIETLALKIRRSRSDSAEVALYKALGRFARPRCLDLALDASPPSQSPIKSTLFVQARNSAVPSSRLLTTLTASPIPIQTFTRTSMV